MKIVVLLGSLLLLIGLAAPAAAQSADQQVIARLRSLGYQPTAPGVTADAAGLRTAGITMPIASPAFTSVAVSTQLYYGYATLWQFYRQPERLNVQLVYNSRYTVRCYLAGEQWAALIAATDREAAWNVLVSSLALRVYDSRLRGELSPEDLTVGEVNSFFQPLPQPAATLRSVLAGRGYLVSGVVSQPERSVAEVMMARVSVALDKAQLQQLYDGWAAARNYYPDALNLRVSTTLRTADGRFAVVWPLDSASFDAMTRALRAGDNASYTRLLQQSFTASRVVNLSTGAEGAGADFISRYWRLSVSGFAINGKHSVISGKEVAKWHGRMYTVPAEQIWLYSCEESKCA